MHSLRNSKDRKVARKYAWAATRRREAAALMKRLGLDRAIAQIPHAVREHVLSVRMPLPRCEVDPSVTDPVIREELKQNWDLFIGTAKGKVTIDIPESVPKIFPRRIEQHVTLKEIYSVLFGVMRGFYSLGSTTLCAANEEQARPVNDLGRVLSRLCRAMGNAMSEKVVTHTLQTCAMLSRADEGVYWFHPVWGSVQEGPSSVWTIGRAVPPSRSFLIDGKCRTAFRLGFTDRKPGFSEVNIDASLVGGAEGHKLPVYIQRHALHRLRDRMGKLPEAGDFYAGLSLLNPVVVKQPNSGDYLIQFRYFGMTLGYFAASVMDGCLVLKTFLFVTMSQTPEGQKLYDLLRVTYGDKEWLRLHDIDTFVETDLFDDPVIGAALRASGLEDLALLRDAVPDAPRRPFAEELKTFLRIDGHREAKLMWKIEEMGYGEMAEDNNE